MLLGLSAREVRRRFDDIVEFSELERFIDTPVKFYSSGMTLRLGFSVIAHIDPTILLVDEILAVGDARFSLKCFERLRSLQREGATILLVSHSMQMIRQICERAVLIRGGRIEYSGEIENAIARHERSLVRKSSSPSESIVEFLDARFLASGRQALNVAYDDPVEVELRVRFHQRVDDPMFTLGVITNAGLFGGFNTTQAGRGWRTFHPEEETTIRLSFPARLAGGAYRLLIDVKDQSGDDRLALHDELILTVSEQPGSAGIVDLCADIRVGEGRTRTLEQAQ
jgi:energy-coupling factor transporter ATP-binding protein EcfA2